MNLYMVISEIGYNNKVKENQMPNWCENTLTIRADKKEDMKELKSLLNDTLEYDDYGMPYGLLGAIISMPKELENTIKGRTKEKPNGDKYNWYDWCCNNWGTKWYVDCQDYIIEDDFAMQNTNVGTLSMKWNSKEELKDKFVKPTGENKKLIFVTSVK